MHLLFSEIQAVCNVIVSSNHTWKYALSNILTHVWFSFQGVKRMATSHFSELKTGASLLHIVMCEGGLGAYQDIPKPYMVSNTRPGSNPFLRSIYTQNVFLSFGYVTSTWLCRRSNYGHCVAAALCTLTGLSCRIH